MKKITVPFYISHQGCPHTCIFCDQRIISGSSGALPGEAEILGKIDLWRRSSPDRPVEVAFFGGTFTLLDHVAQQKLLAPVQPLLANGAVSGVRISTRPDAIDPKNVSWLAGQGVKVIELGVQSMDDTILAAAGRGHDSAASVAALKCIRAAGVTAGAQLMPGLPGDSAHSSLRSLEQVIAAGAHFIRLYPVVVLRGTELAKKYESGEYLPLGIQEGVAVCKVMLQAALKNPVEVIRIGLQADESLSTDTVLAGCWHPAFGQLVYSELFFDLLVQTLPDLNGTMPLQVRCHPSRVSDIIGHKKKNIARLLQRGVVLGSVLPDNHVSRSKIMLSDTRSEIEASIVTDLRYDGEMPCSKGDHA